MTAVEKIKIPVRQSLSYQQSKQTVVVAFVIGLVLSTVQIIIDYSAEQAEFSKSVANVLETANSSAFHAAYNLDENGAQQIALGLVSNTPIVSATIIDNFQNILGSAQNSNPSSTSTLDNWVFGSSYEIVRPLEDTTIHSKVVGELRITVAPSLMADSFLQRAVVVFVSGIVRNTILALAIFAVFYYTFTRSILRATLPILKGKDKNEIELPENHKNDEIGALIRAFNDHLAIIEQQNRQISENNQNLEALISTRTEELNQRNKELEMERKLAIEASMAKSDFLAMMSHEIRTPMNGILGMAELLEKQTSNQASKEYADAIVESSKSMLTLMNTVLDYSKYEKSQMNFVHTPFEIEQILQSIIFLLSASAEKKQITLAANIDQDIPKIVYGDQEKLRQVMLNLITNAIKFTEQGQVNVSAKLANTDQENNGNRIWVELSVIDSGIGIEAQEQPHLFEPYTQANSSIASRYGGSGMGLAICREIVNQQGGKIWCESQAGQGSTFTCLMPFEIRAKENTQNTNANFDELKTNRSLSILVADDLRINRKLLKGQLEVEGHNVVLAEDGQRALEALEQYKIDVLLIDLHMPGMDGIETTHHVREGDHKNLPIIGVTANISEQKAEECIAAGMNLVISKPVDLRKLNTGLYQVMSQTSFSEEIPTKDALVRGLIDGELVSQHLDALGKEKLRTLYLEAKDSASRRIAKLKQHALDDFSEIKLEAHALAGLCANFGMHRLANSVEELENAAVTQSTDKIAQLRSELEDLLEQTLSELSLYFPEEATW